jgi:hypothetical protein
MGESRYDGRRDRQVTWRIALTIFYAIACGTLLAMENFNPEMSDALLLVAWLAAPVVGFLVGRWWVLLVVLAVLVGRAIGWDAGDNDGNSAFWWPYLLTTTVFFGGPLLVGVLASGALEARRRRPAT